MATRQSVTGEADVHAPFHPTRPEVWLVDLAASAHALESTEAATPRLSDDDAARIAATKDAAARGERRAAHIALRLLIERAAGPAWRRIPYARTPTGKPTLDGASVAFSLSHSGGLALIAISGAGPIGVDIERSRPLRIPDARRQRIEEVAAGLAPHSPLPAAGDARCLQAWVRLEALAKAHGTGIGPLLEAQVFGRAPRPGAEADAAANSSPHLAVHDLGLSENTYAAVALEAPILESLEAREPPRLGRFPADAAAIATLLL